MEANKDKQGKHRIAFRKSISFRSISGIVLLLILFALIVGYIGYQGFSTAILEQFSDGGILTAETAANIVDGDDFYRYSLSGGKTAEYRKAESELQSLCNSSDSTFIYVIEPDTTDYAHIKFLFAVMNYDSHYESYGFGYVRETTNDDYRNKYKRLYDGVSNREIVVRDTGYIETDKHITAMVPIRGSDNTVKGIMCVQRQLDVLADVRNDYIGKVIVALGFLALLIIFGQGLYLHITLIDPLEKITAEARRFADESVSTGIKLTDSIHNKDEIGHLARSIDRMEERIGSYVKHITTITAERERIEAELSLAARIQEGMLPNEFPAFPDYDEFDIYASMTPAKEVGGDFYDYFMTDEDHLVLVIADVSGKGIPAALFMMSAMISIRNNVMIDVSPAEVLTAVNEQICRNNEEEMFVTVWLGILDLKTGVITAANAGHEYPMIMRPDGQFELLRDQHGLVIGGMDDVEYNDYTIEFPKGSKLFVYTDGLPEAQNSDGVFFGTERALDVLNEHRDGDPKALLDAMSEAVDVFNGTEPKFDDLTMLCIESFAE